MPHGPPGSTVISSQSTSVLEGVKKVILEERLCGATEGKGPATSGKVAFVWEFLVSFHFLGLRH